MIVHLTENGLYWKAQWTDSLGRRGSRSLGRRDDVSKRQADLLCADIAKKESVTSGKAPTLAEWQERYFALRSDLSDGTEYLHELTFKYLVQHFKSDAVRLDKIRREHAAEFRSFLEKRTCKHRGKVKTMEPASVAMNIRNCKTIFEKAVTMDIIDFNPFDRESGAAPDVDRDWAEITHDDLGSILDHCPNDGWRAMFALCRWAGLRLNEALDVRIQDINFQTGMIQVANWRGNGKVTTKKKARLVPMRPELAKLLTANLEGAKDGSLGPTDDVQEGDLHRDATAIIARAGIQAYAKPFHTLRKCCESEWMETYPVPDVCRWLGNSFMVAMKHYVRATPETIAKLTGIDPKPIQ